MSLFPVSLSGKRRTSTRTQMILGTVTLLTLVLVLFGLFARYVVTTTLMASVDRDLLERTDRFVHLGPPPRNFGVFNPGNAEGAPMQQPGNFGPNGDNPGPPLDQNGPPDGQPGGGPGDNEPGPDFPSLPFPGNGGGPDDFRRPDDRRPFEQQLDPYRPRIFDLSGQALDGFDGSTAWDISAVRTASARNQPVFTTVTLNGARLRILTRPHHSRSGGEDFVQVAYPLTRVYDAIAAVDKALIILVPIALIVAAFGGAFVTRSVFERVGQMVKATSIISANDLSQRLPVLGRDEFAELAETFNALIARVQSAFEEQARVVEQQRRFTADASHELKTPLTVIRGTTSLALSGTGNLDRQATKEIDDAAKSMSRLVQDLIYLARSDAGQLGRERIRILVIDPLQRAVARVSSLTSAHIMLQMMDENVEVLGDEGELNRLFTNLLNNAAQHTPAHGEIRVALFSTNSVALIKISDTGSGIAKEHIAHLFERFYRIDSARSRDQGGSGLGLSICKGIVEAHDGTIAITSQVGRGTEVTVTLPRS